MFKKAALLSGLCVLSLLFSAYQFGAGYGESNFPASKVSVDADNFSTNLSTLDDTVQKALATIDALSLGGAGVSYVGVISGLPGAPDTGNLAVVTDGSADDDCTVGGGATVNLCIYSGSAWVIAGDGTSVSGADSVSVNGSATTDPDFVSTGTVDFVNSSNTISANVNWIDIEALSPINEGAINWNNWVNGKMYSGGVNWTDVEVQAPITESMINDLGSYITGSSPTITSPTINTSLNLNYATASELVSTDGSKNLVSLAVATYPSLTELSYVKGVTSAIQTQLGTKAPSTSPTFATSITGSYLTASEILITDASKNIVSAAVATYPSLTELTYVKGVTSAIQTQLNGKESSTSNDIDPDRLNGDSVDDNLVDPAIVAGVQFGAAFPVSPTSGDQFVVTDDSVAGACDSAAGSARSLCQWTGAAWTAVGGGGSGTPGGSNTQVQYNNSGSFGGISGATTDGTTLTLVAPVLGTPASVTLTNATGLVSGGLASTFISGLTAVGTFASGDGFLCDEVGVGLRRCDYDDLPTASGSDTNSVKTYVWPMAATLPLQAAESIPPITKDTGTNNDILAVSFNDSADECRTVNFIVPTDVQSGSTITFGITWYSQTATTGNVVWDFRHTGTGTEGEDWDQSLTTESAASDAVQGTVDLITRTEWTETLSNLGWAADDMITGVICRDGDGTAGTDDMTGDAEAITFYIEIPRS